MRIVPINNNYTNNFKGKSAISKLSNKFNAGLTATLILAGAFGYCKNKEFWDEFIKEEKQERVDNLRIRPEVKNFDAYETAVNYSFDRILPWINLDNPKEYCVYIDNNTYNILTEIRGQERSVTMRKTAKMLFKENFCNNFSYTSVHGHPGQECGGTTTFSPTDLKTFLTNDFCTENYVLNTNRKYCRLKKEENYRKPTEEELNKIIQDYERICDITMPWVKTIKDEKGNVLFDFIDYPMMHDALDRYLKPFGISYTTTFGTYGVMEDIYENGYHEGFSGGKLLSTVVAKQVD